MQGLEKKRSTGLGKGGAGPKELLRTKKKPKE